MRLKSISETLHFVQDDSDNEKSNVLNAGQR